MKTDPQLLSQNASRFYERFFMLGDISGLERIYIVCGYTDMQIY